MPPSICKQRRTGGGDAERDRPARRSVRAAGLSGDQRRHRPRPRELHHAGRARRAGHGDTVKRVAHRVESDARGEVAGGIIIRSDGREGVDRRAGVNAEHRVEAAPAGVEGERAVRRCRPAKPNRPCAAHGGVVRLAALPRRAARAAAHAAGAAGDDEAVRERIVESGVEVQLDVAGRATVAVHREAIRHSGCGREGHEALVAESRVVVGSNQRESRHAAACVHRQHRVEAAAVGADGRGHVRGRGPAPPDRARTRVARQVQRLARLTRRDFVVARVAARRAREDNRVGEMIVRRRLIVRRRGRDVGDENARGVVRLV